MTTIIEKLSEEEAVAIFKRAVRFSKDIGTYKYLRWRSPNRSLNYHLNRVRLGKDIRSIIVELIWTDYLNYHSGLSWGLESSRMARIEASVYIMELLILIRPLLKKESSRLACIASVYEEFNYMWCDSVKTYTTFHGKNLEKFSDAIINKIHDIIDYINDNYPLKLTNDLSILPPRR